MARTLTPRDAHAIMDLLLKQATGDTSLTVVDASTFASAGELVLATGMENVFNAINIVMNRLIVASRPYNAKMRIVGVKEVGEYSNRARKISFYSKYALPDGSHNTQLFTNLADGYTSGDNGGASTKSQGAAPGYAPRNEFRRIRYLAALHHPVRRSGKDRFQK